MRCGLWSAQVNGLSGRVIPGTSSEAIQALGTRRSAEGEGAENDRAAAADRRGGRVDPPVAAHDPAPRGSRPRLSLRSWQGRLPPPHRGRRRAPDGGPPDEAAGLLPGGDARPAGDRRPARRRGHRRHPAPQARSGEPTTVRGLRRRPAPSVCCVLCSAGAEGPAVRPADAPQSWAARSGVSRAPGKARSKELACQRSGNSASTALSRTRVSASPVTSREPFRAAAPAASVARAR